MFLSILSALPKKDKQNKKSSYFRDKVIPALKDLKDMKEKDLKAIRNSLKNMAKEVADIENSLTYESLLKATKEEKQRAYDNESRLKELRKSLKDNLFNKYKEKIYPRLDKNLEIFKGYKKVKHSLLANKKLLTEKNKLNNIAIDYVMYLRYDKYSHNSMGREINKLKGKKGDKMYIKWFKSKIEELLESLEK